jgi:hypothetical protein
LVRLLKCFRFSGNEKEVNQNHFKHIFAILWLQYKNLKRFKPIHL